jgi:hypothetical protein
MKKIIKYIFRLSVVAALPGIVFLIAGCEVLPTRPPWPELRQNLAVRAGWTTNCDAAGSTLQLTEISEGTQPVLRADFNLKSERGYAEMIQPLERAEFSGRRPLVIRFKSGSDCTLEAKLTDRNGTVHGRHIPLKDSGGKWTTCVLYPAQVEYWWGTNDPFDTLSEIRLAFVGNGAGSAEFSHIGIAVKAVPTDLKPLGPIIDPDSELPGIGFRQRRAAKLVPVDPGVVEWLKQVQDTSTPQQQLLRSMENDEIQTFNNALVAMAFMLEGERERAERILDFYADAVDPGNPDRKRQNFYYKGEPRGFYQATIPVETNGTVEFRSGPDSDRWMGDMAWLLFAYLYYSRQYDADRYRDIMDLLQVQLEKWYIKDPQGHGGYVRHGWIDDDTQLHESFGHPEGNIDCYALFRLLGDEQRAAQIRQWLDQRLKGDNLPLDLYTWRVLAYGPEVADCLNIPDYDLRYRKTLERNGKKISGVYHGADSEVQNIWLDGVGHMACAYFAAGNFKRGNFYANQLDKLLLEYEINGKPIRALPFVANNSGVYDWVDTRKGFISVGAWYVFAKHRFNPMTLEKYEPE